MQVKIVNQDGGTYVAVVDPETGEHQKSTTLSVGDTVTLKLEGVTSIDIGEVVSTGEPADVPGEPPAPAGEQGAPASEGQGQPPAGTPEGSTPEGTPEGEPPAEQAGEPTGEQPEDGQPAA